jgi:hypothetical protein
VSHKTPHQVLEVTGAALQLAGFVLLIVSTSLELKRELDEDGALGTLGRHIVDLLKYWFEPPAQQRSGALRGSIGITGNFAGRLTVGETDDERRDRELRQLHAALTQREEATTQRFEAVEGEHRSLRDKLEGLMQEARDRQDAILRNALRREVSAAWIFLPAPV